MIGRKKEGPIVEVQQRFEIASLEGNVYVIAHYR